jgi:hypothetical protein
MPGGGAISRRPYIWLRISPGSLKSILSGILDVCRRNKEDAEEYRGPTASIFLEI